MSRAFVHGRKLAQVPNLIKLLWGDTGNVFFMVPMIWKRRARCPSFFTCRRMKRYTDGISGSLVSKLEGPASPISGGSSGYTIRCHQA